MASNRAGMWSAIAPSGRSRWKGCFRAAASQRSRMSERVATSASPMIVRSEPAATDATRASTSAVGAGSLVIASSLPRTPLAVTALDWS